MQYKSLDRRRNDIVNMVSFLATVLFSAVLLFVTSKLYQLRRNVARAQSSGLRVVAMPVHILSVPWILFQKALLPLAKVMPEGWPEKWIPYVSCHGTDAADNCSLVQSSCS